MININISNDTINRKEDIKFLNKQYLRINNLIKNINI